ncbi:hypothetical protein KEM56_007650 [Ascosphaera pollenicola]|nr:hypothetical protein KEM56_007650 [Ascosphaera pollenicola]
MNQPVPSASQDSKSTTGTTTLVEDAAAVDDDYGLPQPVSMMREEFDVDGLSMQALRPSRFRRYRSCCSPENGGIRGIGRCIVRWVTGPDPPRRYYIRPWYQPAHEALLKLRDRLAPKKNAKIGLLLVFYCVWFGVFAGMYAAWKTAPNRKTPAYGIPVRKLTCESTLWLPKNECGMNGDLCRPFTGEMAFRCPSNCKDLILLNPHTVGPEEVNYQPLVVGGSVYRGDSYICAAALHAGVISNADGGCGVIKRLEDHTGFDASTNHGISSVAFNSSFPLAFEFQQGSASRCNGRDQQWSILAITVVFTVLISLLTTSPAVWFFSVFVGVFIQTGLISDPPGAGALSVSETFSLMIGRLLPALFVAVILFYTCIRRTVEGLEATIDKAILWLGPCWFAALNNHTFDKWVPISRLTGHDLTQQPGALTALAIIIVVLVAAAVGQIWYLRQEGRLVNYLKLYAIFVLIIIICVPLPSLTFRIHHYILALLLLPGTSIQVRPALIYQGLLVGLFINGVARWDFASILETTEALRGDGVFNSPLPTISDPAIEINSLVSTISFNVTVPNVMDGLEGLSVLIDDVEKFRTGFNFKDEFVTFEHWRDNSITLPEYLRFGFFSRDRALDYTKASTWNADGTWTRMADGPS